MLQKLLCTISPQGLFSRYILYTIIHVKVLSPSQDFSLSTCVQCFSVSVSFGCNKKNKTVEHKTFFDYFNGFSYTLSSLPCNMFLFCCCCFASTCLVNPISASFKRTF